MANIGHPHGSATRRHHLSFSDYSSIALMIISVTLIGLVVLQARGGGLGSVFGSDTNIYKTRRGMEKTLYNATIVFAVLFLVTSLLTVLIGGS